MRKQGKHARRPRWGRVGVVAAAGGAAALVATFPSAAAGASTLPGAGTHPEPGTEAAVSTASSLGDTLARPLHLADLAPVQAKAVEDPAKYTVKPGDTLGAIAAKFCASAGRYLNLAAANRVANPDLILAGATLNASNRACHHAPLVVRQPVATTSAVSATSYTPRHSGRTASAPRQSVTSYAAPGSYSFAGLERLWVSAGGPAWAERSAAAVAECESGGRSNAYNPSGATGLWQILGAVRPGSLYDPMSNARNAVAKFEASGDTWAQWVCQP